MLKIINLNNLLKMHLFTTLIVSILIYQTSENNPLWKLITVSASISTFLILIISINFIAREIWWLLRIFNDDLFPDLNGKWEGNITFKIKNDTHTDPNNSTEIEKSIKTRARIKQSLIKSEIEMYGEKIVSGTLDVSFTKVLGLNKIYYSYISEPPMHAWKRFSGITILNIISDNGIITLQGNYFTERKTTGTITLKKTDTCGCIKSLIVLKRILVLSMLFLLISYFSYWLISHT